MRDAIIIIILLLNLVFIIKSFSDYRKIGKNSHKFKKTKVLLDFFYLPSLSLSYLILTINSNTENLKIFYVNLLIFSLSGLSFVLFFCSITCEYIARAGHGEESKAYKKATAWLDFLYVSLGFIGVVSGLSQLMTTELQNISDAEVINNIKMAEQNHMRFVRYLGLIEADCFNGVPKELNNICTETKQYEASLISSTSPYIPPHDKKNIFDATNICLHIKSQKESSFFKDEAIREFCEKPIFTMKKEDIAKISNYKNKQLDYIYVKITKFVWTFLLLISFSARLTKAIFDLYFNRYSISKKSKPTRAI